MVSNELSVVSSELAVVSSELAVVSIELAAHEPISEQFGIRSCEQI